MEDSKNPDLANLLDALRRAAQNARDEAARHGTFVVIQRDGKIVKEYPKLKKRKNSAA